MRWRAALNLSLIHFILIDNQSPGSFQTGYPIRHLHTISLPPTHKVCLLHSSKTHKLSLHVCLPLAHKHTTSLSHIHKHTHTHTHKMKQFPPLRPLRLTQQWELIERLLSQQILFRILNSVTERGRASKQIGRQR